MTIQALKTIGYLSIEYFISKGVGPQFGFFGDAWQTIYQSNKACGLIEHENIKEIKKGSNFRSASKIVEMLNFIRSDLPQRSAINLFRFHNKLRTIMTCITRHPRLLIATLT